MSRVHRLTIAVAASMWVLSLSLMFTPFAEPADDMAGFLRVASINAGAAAACMTTVAVLPWLLRDFYKANVTDYVGAFLAGWAASHEAEPDEPATVTHLSAVR